MFMPKSVDSTFGSIFMGLGGIGRKSKAELGAFRGMRKAAFGVAPNFTRDMESSALQSKIMKRGMRRGAIGGGGALIVGRASGSRGLRARSSGGMAAGQATPDAYPTGMYGN